MHEDGSTPRQTDDNESIEIELRSIRFIPRCVSKLYEIRHRLFLIWLCLFAAITAFFICCSTLYGEGGDVYYGAISITALPSSLVFGFIVAYGFDILFLVFPAIIIPPYYDPVISSIELLIGGYIQWGLLIPQVIECFHERRRNLPLLLLVLLCILTFLVMYMHNFFS